ncbi:hypothetical protein Krac_7902 [Ktedonobacter racemifer DSM 44963]|uniref:Uncharacterized protein n=1 Tax=Ktedonobacter racemifer DSM 44963 TaxID=485913 RepID=D6TLE9_KTERA|nr:hypothetical protein Krac_7902 [Ktedonobacter racemifer DSM 44963]
MYSWSRDKTAFPYLGYKEEETIVFIDTDTVQQEATQERHGPFMEAWMASLSLYSKREAIQGAIRRCFAGRLNGFCSHCTGRR